MISITFYNPETGQIVSNLTCQKEVLHLNLKEGASYIEGEYPYTVYYVDTVTQLPKVKGTSPSDQHVFDFITKQWIDPRTLDDFKSAQWTQIKQARTQAEYAGFTWDEAIFDSDAISQSRITGAVTLAQMSPAFTIDWVLADNSTRTLNQVEMLQVGAALGNHVAEQFSKGVIYRTAIEVATSKEEIEAISWN